VGNWSLGPSENGPKSGANNTAHYIYVLNDVDGSNGDLELSDSKLVIPGDSLLIPRPDADGYCFSFYYYMYGKSKFDRS
jgi:hypothetical protein